MSSTAYELAAEIPDYFVSSPFWQYERMLGHGTYGLAILVGQKGRGSAGFRMVIKVALDSGGTQLRNEISWLKQLNGAMHIVRMIASMDPQSPFLDNNRYPPMSWVFDALVRIRGPLLAMEYINNGNLTTLFSRIEERGLHMPNRMLWSLFLCMVRACIGMAYPIGAALTSPISTLEMIPPGRTPGLLKHGDIALRNIMIGTPGEDKAGLEKEHITGHVFKLIDFGAAEAAPPGLSNNIFEISEALASFITMKPYIIFNQVGMHKGFKTRGAYLLSGPEGDPYPWLDTDLSDLMAECMYLDPERRPTLQQALDRASRAVLDKTPDMFVNPDDETDEAIRNFAQEFILDADSI
ncbi:kinase-like domain-containing protein [Xylaria arbuscula]|nr:kinase-like domain-containing protein [Xylaria arbuscula]